MKSNKNRDLLFNNTSTAFSYRSNMELVKAHIIFYLLNKPLLSRFLISATKLALYLRLPMVIPLIKGTIFAHFCGGENREQSKKIIEKLTHRNMKTVLDYSVEGKNTEESFNETTTEILQTLELSKKNDNIPFIVFKPTGIADWRLLEKIQNNVDLTTNETMALQALKKRLDRICARANQYQIPVLIDAEHSWYQNPIDEMIHGMMARYNKKKAIIFNTFQMYRADMLSRLQQAYQMASKQNYILGVKIVRGAYMEGERERALKMGYKSPILQDKESTDHAFNTGLDFCIKNIERISLICASHNEYSNNYLTLLMNKKKIQKNDQRIWFMQLYGMRDNISFTLADKGYLVAKYLPYGPARSVIPYLIRRVQENSSVAGQSNRELQLLREELNRRKKNKQSKTITTLV